MRPDAAGRIVVADLPPIAVLAAGSTWLVVEKPCGMSIHNDPGKDLCALVLAAVKDGQIPAVRHTSDGIHAVHRLDRDTSGIVLLAADAATLAFLGAQFAERRVVKRYLAIVHGTLELAAARAPWSDWTWPLTASAGGRKDPMGKGPRQACTTRWRPLDNSRHYTLVECEPLTGRKHQIRRHARLAGYPVVGDRRYGSVRSVNFLARQCGFKRLGLHAHALTLILPGDDRQTTFVSGGLPDAMQRLLATDR